MGEYIEREAVLSKLRKVTIVSDDLYGMGIVAGVDFARETIVEQPAADVTPVVHGRWIAQDETFTRFMCSHCKSKNHRGGDNYCPNCGAKMDAEG